MRSPEQEQGMSHLAEVLYVQFLFMGWWLLHLILAQRRRSVEVVTSIS